MPPDPSLQSKKADPVLRWPAQTHYIESEDFPGIATRGVLLESFTGSGIHGTAAIVAFPLRAFLQRSGTLIRLFPVCIGIGSAAPVGSLPREAADVRMSIVPGRCRPKTDCFGHCRRLSTAPIFKCAASGPQKIRTNGIALRPSRCRCIGEFGVFESFAAGLGVLEFPAENVRVKRFTGRRIIARDLGPAEFALFGHRPPAMISFGHIDLLML